MMKQNNESGHASRSSSSSSLHETTIIPNDHQMTSTSHSNVNTFQLNDSPHFIHLIQKIPSTNFDLIERSQCIGLGFDSNGINTVYVIPRLGLDQCTTTSNVTEEEILQQMILFFLKTTELIVSDPYNIVYGHSIFSIYSQMKTLQYLYQTLPRRYKKNLQNLYIVHPTGRIKIFVRMSKLFFGKKVIEKMKFVSCIAELQSIISPLTLHLPPAYLLWEDQIYFHRVIDTMPSLNDLYDHNLHAPVFIVQCIDFLKRYGLHREGLFRVAGDQILFEVAKVRIHKTGGTNVIICPSQMKSHHSNQHEHQMTSETETKINEHTTTPPQTSSTHQLKLKTSHHEYSQSLDDDMLHSLHEHQKYNSENNLSLNDEFKRSIDRQQTFDSQQEIGRSISLRDFPPLPPRLSLQQRAEGIHRKSLYPIADVVLHEVDEVAQLLKSFLRDLPEPVITTNAYKALMDASKLHLQSFEDSIHVIEEILHNPELMPTAHINTFEYLLSFLATLARESQINKMSPDNISVVFAPTLMRMEMTDPTQALQEVKISQKILKALLLKRMETNLSMEFSSLRMSDGMNTRLGKVLR